MSVARFLHILKVVNHFVCVVWGVCVGLAQFYASIILRLIGNPGALSLIGKIFSLIGNFYQILV